MGGFNYWQLCFSNKTDDNGFSTRYFSNFEYDKDWQLDYIYTDEGRIRVKSSFTYDYYLKDHLGNTRVVFSDNGSGSAAVQQVSNYYPFGMQFNGAPTYQTAQGDNQYLYNGKELQQDFALDWYDYGARMYDPALGIFHTIYPLTDFAPGITPYNYALNNPVSMVDADGLWPGFIDDWLKNRARKKKYNTCSNGKSKVPPKKFKPEKKTARTPGRIGAHNISPINEDLGHNFPQAELTLEKRELPDENFINTKPFPPRDVRHTLFYKTWDGSAFPGTYQITPEMIQTDSKGQTLENFFKEVGQVVSSTSIVEIVIFTDVSINNKGTTDWGTPVNAVQLIKQRGELLTKEITGYPYYIPGYIIDTPVDNNNFLTKKRIEVTVLDY